MKLSVISLFFLAPCSAMIMDSSKLHIDPQSLSMPHRLKDLNLYHENNEFHVLKDGRDSIVKSHRMDSLLRRLKQNKHELKSFLDSSGYLKVGQIEDGQFSLEADGRVVGGGPITGEIFYWGTKLIAYVGITCLATTAAATVTASLPASAPVSAGIAVGAKAVVGANLPTSVIGTTIASSLGVGTTTVIAEGAAGVLGTAGSVSTALAYVETAAMTARYAGYCIPWLP